MSHNKMSGFAFFSLFLSLYFFFLLFLLFFFLFHNRDRITHLTGQAHQVLSSHSKIILNKASVHDTKIQQANLETLH